MAVFQELRIQPPFFASTRIRGVVYVVQFPHLRTHKFGTALLQVTPCMHAMCGHNPSLNVGACTKAS
jgi:hypothetical protein